MSSAVFSLVLLAAVMHAGWNAMLKLRLEPFLAMVLLNAASGLVALPVLLAVGTPEVASWPWLAGSMAFHAVYFLSLTEAYRRADMSQIYPLARGSAPLLTAMFSLAVLGEPVSTTGVAGIVVLGAGIFLIARKGRGDVVPTDRIALACTALTALSICGYTLTDGIGGRVAGSPHAYSAALFVLIGVMLTAFAFITRRPAGLRPLLGHLPSGLAGGTMIATCYGIVIWAMTVTPIPLVAAVRETSVLFGAALGVWLLKERLRPHRIGAAALILVGLVLIRLQ